MSDGSLYASLLERLGKQQESIVVVDVGLGTSMQTNLFATAFPKRYVNLGIAEANAVGFASGLARRGFKPVVHSFANFLARRAHDQIAVSVALPGLPVILIGGSCGLFDGRNGPSHFGGDDLAVFLALPGFFVFEPADAVDLPAVLDWAVASGGPTYVRLRRHGLPVAIVEGRGERRPTNIIATRGGRLSVTLVAIGAMLDEVVTATRMLADEHVAVDLLHVLRLKPLDPGPIMDSGRRTKRVVVVENHVAHGGAGSVLTSLLATEGIPCHTLGLPDSILPAGEPRWLLALTGLDASSIAESVVQLLRRKLVPCSVMSCR